MPGCSAFGCTNRTEKGYSLRVFPKDPMRRKLWALKTGRKNWMPTDGSHLCDVHFDADQWVVTGVNGRKRLKRDAVPTIFDYSPWIYKWKVPVRKTPVKRSILQDKILKDENISKIKSETPEEPPQCISELNESLSDSPELELSSRLHCPNITPENNSMCHTETQREMFVSDVYLNNAVDGLKKISAQESNLSEFTIFGLYVASQLQQIPLKEAYKLKEEIQNILKQSCPQSLKEPSFFSYKPQVSSDKDENSYWDLQSKLPLIKSIEKDKNQSTQHMSSCPVVLQSFVFPSTAINPNISYNVYAIDGSNVLGAVHL